MSTKWQDTSKSNENVKLEYMLDDVQMFDQGRRNYVSALAASLIGLSLEQVESKLERLEGHHAYSFTVNNSERNFRVSQKGVRGWDGVAFTLFEGGVVQEASIY